MSLVEEDCYLKPAVKQDDEGLKAIIENLNKYLNVQITYQIGNTTKILNQETFHSWLSLGDNHEVVIDEEQVEELISKYESLGYTVEEYDGSDDGMVGVIYSKKFNLSDVSSEDDVVFHLETIGTKELKNPKLFTVKKGLLSTTYKASMVYDTKNAEVDGLSKEELEENASSIDITYSVTLPKKAKKHNARCNFIANARYFS